MSRKSEQGSAGDGESPSLLPSYENSPRKTPETPTTGPFGDHPNDKKISFLMYHIGDTNNSTDSEDQECFELKTEYLERLRLIREKLASIDIANKSYYSNCFKYPPQPQGQCVITEIFDDGTENNDCKDDAISNFKANNTANDISAKPSEESLINNLTESKGDEQNNTTKNISKEQNYITENKGDKQNDSVRLKLSGSIDQDKSQEDQCLASDKANEIFIAENDTTEKLDLDIKSILNYGSFPYDNSSSVELLDLNYNPPKKKPCIRETTPKMVLSEGAIMLPYHTRLGLQNDSSCVHKEAFESEEKCNEIEDINKINLEDSIEQNSHIFPEVQVETIEEARDIKSSGSSHSKLEPFEEKQSPTISTGKDNLYVLFLDALEQSSTGSPKTNRTIVTETTVTIESPTRKLKKRRLLLRSARNKVKPVDTISLWEEIRTMEAINRSKRQNSSSSKESYFQEILLKEVERDHKLALDLKSVGSLEVPRKASIIARFPSITKITNFCQSAFKKKSQTTVEGNVAKKDPHEKSHKKEECLPKVANTLLNLRQEQDLNFESDNYTSSSEARSEYSYPEEDIDTYYKPDCVFCFCL